MRTPIRRGRFWAFAQPNGIAKAVIMIENACKTALNSRAGFQIQGVATGIKCEAFKAPHQKPRDEAIAIASVVWILLG